MTLLTIIIKTVVNKIVVWLVTKKPVVGLLEDIMSKNLKCYEISKEVGDSNVFMKCFGRGWCLLKSWCIKVRTKVTIREITNHIV